MKTAVDRVGRGKERQVNIRFLAMTNHYVFAPGGYLRALTEKGREGEFSVGPMLMAALKTTVEPAKMVG